jgi:SAM-dependent methyltransferase
MRTLKDRLSYSHLITKATTAVEAAFPDSLEMKREKFIISGREAWGPYETAVSNDVFASAYKEQLQILFAQLLKVDSFLDVGCGRGNILAIARDFNPEIKASGIEIQKHLAKQAKQHGNIWNGNALKYADYGKHDLIYMYRPFVDLSAQVKLETLVIEQMRPGTILVSLKPCDSRLLKSVKVEGLFACRGVFVKT